MGDTEEVWDTLGADPLFSDSLPSGAYCVRGKAVNGELVERTIFCRPRSHSLEGKNLFVDDVWPGALILADFLCSASREAEAPPARSQSVEGVPDTLAVSQDASKELDANSNGGVDGCGIGGGGCLHVHALAARASSNIHQTTAQWPSPTGLRVLELGAGAALPSLVACVLGAKQVVISDHPASQVLSHGNMLLSENKFRVSGPGSDVGSDPPNAMNRGRGDGEPDIRVMEHIWGDTPDSLLVCTGPERPGFDLILLAEPLWKDTYPQHRQLLHSVRACLKKQSKPQLSSSHPQCRQRCGPCALVAFAHRPTSVTSTANGARKEEHPESAHTAAHDLEFFSMAREEFGLSVELLLSTWCKDVSGVWPEHDHKVNVKLYRLLWA